jgi:hypothetical protein
VPPPPPYRTHVGFPPLPVLIPDTLGEQVVDIGQRAVSVDEEPEALAIGLSRPLAVPRLAARVVRIEPDAAKPLPAAMRTAFHVAAVLVLFADSRPAIRTVFHRARSHRRVRLFTTLDPVGGWTLRSTKAASFVERLALLAQIFVPVVDSFDALDHMGQAALGNEAADARPLRQRLGGAAPRPTGSAVLRRRSDLTRFEN